MRIAIDSAGRLVVPKALRSELGIAASALAAEPPCRPPPFVRRGLRAAVDRGFRGGALYDALIAVTAQHHDHTLVSADRRAAPVDRAFDLEVIYLLGE